jgi:hypothetical protein
MSRFRSESRFSNPGRPARSQVVNSEHWFKYEPNTVQWGNSQPNRGSMIDNADSLRGRPYPRRHGSFKNSYMRSGPELAEGNNNS